MVKSIGLIVGSGFRTLVAPPSVLGYELGCSTAPGTPADLVVVRGNPAADIGATRDIAAVILAGVILDRAALAFDAMDDPGFRTAGYVAAY